MSKLGKLFRAWVYLEAAFIGAALGAASKGKLSSGGVKRSQPRARLAPGPKFEPLSTRSRVTLSPGSHFAAELDVPFFVAPLVSESALIEGLKKEGFRPILVQSEMPLGWPGAAGADWYVLAEYTGRPKAEEVPGAVRALYRRG